MVVMPGLAGETKLFYSVRDNILDIRVYCYCADGFFAHAHSPGQAHSCFNAHRAHWLIFAILALLCLWSRLGCEFSYCAWMIETKRRSGRRSIKVCWCACPLALRNMKRCPMNPRRVPLLCALRWLCAYRWTIKLFDIASAQSSCWASGPQVMTQSAKVWIFSSLIKKFHQFEDPTLERYAGRNDLTDVRSGHTLNRFSTSSFTLCACFTFSCYYWRRFPVIYVQIAATLILASFLLRILYK